MGVGGPEGVVSRDPCEKERRRRGRSVTPEEFPSPSEKGRCTVETGDVEEKVGTVVVEVGGMVGPPWRDGCWIWDCKVGVRPLSTSSILLSSGKKIRILKV